VAHAGGDDPSASYKAVAEDPHGGKQCVKYHKTGLGSKNNHFDYIVTLEPKTYYTVSAWVKSDGRLNPLLSIEGMDWRPVAQAKCGAGAKWHPVRLTFHSGDRAQVRIVWYGGSMGRRYQGHPGASWLDDVVAAKATAEELAALDATKRTDTRGWFEFPLRWDEIAPGAAFTIGGLHDPPAGKHGFVQARGGHLCFPDGRRARFWGVCLCGRAAFPTHEQAEVIAARMAKWGINIVRLHALEVQIFDPKSDHTRSLDPHMVDRLDYFVAQLIKRGIYIFMDWRTAWRTRKGDGLAPRWLYHWTMLDDRFVELNQNYARVLYLHRNAYTGRRYVDEPAIAVFEIVNEKDIFSVFTGKYRKHPDTVRLKAAIKERWNKWLLGQYRDRAGLAKAWTNARGVCGLLEGEDPAKGSVDIPLPAHALGSWDRDNAAVTGPARGSDALRFLHDLQTDYFLRMRRFLRGLGVKAPISGTNWHMNIRPNARSNAQLDFTENHGYWDHAQPWGPSRKKHTRTRNMPHVRQDPIIGEMTLLDKHSRGAVPGKPFIVSEWNFDSPNEYRCEGPITMAAYGALQDWDGIICYAFYGGWSRSWDQVDEADELGMYLGSEELLNDPSLMCQWPAAAAIFLRGDVQAAKRLVHVGYSKVDTFFAQGHWSQETAHLGFLPFVHRVRHCYFDDAYAGDGDVVVASGLSSAGSYAKAARAVLVCDNPAADVHSKRVGRQQLVAGLYPALRFRNVANAEIQPNEALGISDRVALSIEPGIDLDTVPAGAVAFGVDRGAGLCLGFVDRRFVVSPHGGALRNVDAAWFYRLFTWAMRHWGLAGETNGEPGALTSDTGELRWRSTRGVLTIDTARSQGAVGFLGGKELALANLRIRARTRYCSVVLTTTDGAPISRAKRLLLTAVARSENTGQRWEDDRTTIPADGRGRAPVLVEPVDADVTIASDLADAAWTLHLLDPAGRPKKSTRLRLDRGRIAIRLAPEHKTVFYALEAADPR